MCDMAFLRIDARTPMMPQSEFPRQFVRRGEELSKWEHMEPYFQTLLRSNLDTVGAVNEWLLDCSELAACIDEISTDLYVRMTCQTDDATRKAAYLDFVEHIEPKCKPMWHALDKKYAECAAAAQLPTERFEVFNRSVRGRVELFREKNVTLEIDEAKLEQRYQEINGAMTATFDGKEQTLQQLSSYLERPDRAVRQEVWELSAGRRAQDADVLDEIFDALFHLRHTKALNADLPDFRAYAFKSKERFDYTPDDCMAFHDAVEGACVPLLRSEHESRKRTLGVESLRPWDLSVDPRGRPPLRPAESVDALVSTCADVFSRLDPTLDDQFREMARRGALDIASRKGKAPGGYQTTYHESRRPFIFMNAVGIHRDVRTLIHEAGHAFHTLACRSDPLIHYRSAPIEFAEVASMGMEMLAYEHFDVFYDGDDLRRAKRQQLEGIIHVLPWIATIDAFQQWMYTHPDHTHDERKAQWLGLHDRFGGLEDYEGYEDALGRGWHRQLHLFEVPFYYIEYGIAQLGALQIWALARKNRGEAIRLYREALSLGGSRPLPELFAAAGIRFDFSIDTIGPLMDRVKEALAELGD